MLKAGVRFRPRVGRASDHRSRPVPSEYADAVETWARQHGGHATLRWLPAPMNCWCVILSYRAGDPRQQGADDGEKVLLHDFWSAEQWMKHAPQRAPRHKVTGQIRSGAYAYELDELGVEGLITRLNQGNILSGRGQFTSLEQPVAEQRAKHHAASEKRREAAKDNAGARARDIRRSIMKIPFLGVGISFGKKATPENTQAEA